MNLKELHEPFKDDDSPSVEGQIRWLQKQGFGQHQIEQTMVTVYSEIERGEVPKIWTAKEKLADGRMTEVKVYLAADRRAPGSRFKSRDIVTGWELDQYLLSTAKRIRTKELSVMVKHMEDFEEKLRKKWEAQQKPRGLFKRWRRKP